MKLKPEVEATGVDWRLWFALGAADVIHPGLVVTSLRDGTHKAGSLHYAGRAADLRTKDLTPEGEQAFWKVLKDWLTPYGFDVILETTPRHIHIEYDPPVGQEFLQRTED